MFTSKFYCKKIYFFSSFAGCFPLGVNKIMVDCSISVILVLSNRPRMSDKFFKLFVVFISFIQDKKGICFKGFIPSSQILKPLLYTFKERFYSFTCVMICMENLSPTLTTFSSWKIHPTFFLSEMSFHATARILFLTQA